MKCKVMVLSVIVLLLASVASAAVKEGDTEVNLLGGWIDIDAAVAGGDSDGLLAMGNVTQFVTPNISLGVAGLGAFLDLAGTDVDIYAIGGEAKYHFTPDKEYVPYVGVKLLWGSADVSGAGGGDADGLVYGPNVGVRFDLNENNDLFVQYDYLLMDGDIDQAVDSLMSIMFGIIHTFK